MNDDKSIRSAFEGVDERLRMVHGALRALADLADTLPYTFRPGTCFELFSQFVRLRQARDETHAMLGHRGEVIGRDQGRIGDINHTLGIKEAFLHLSDHLEVPRFIAGIAVVNTAHEWQSFARNDQAVNELSQVGTMILAVAVRNVKDIALGMGVL